MEGRTLNYVVTSDGELIIGRIDRGRPVQAAGEVVIRDGKVKYINNASGHYDPKGPAARQAAEAAFGRVGFDVEGKYIEMILDPQLGWIPVDGQ